MSKLPTAARYPGKELEAMSFAVNYHEWILDEFTPYLTGTVVEVGAGIGSISRMLLRKRLDALVAFEPCGDMHALLEQELRGSVSARAVNDFFNPVHVPDGMDSILYLNVLEHIENDAAELGKAFEAVKRNGHLLIFVPALAWLYSDFDRQIGHYRRYTRERLTRLVKDAGFRLVKTRYFDLAGIIPWYIVFVLLKRSPGSGSVALYDKLVVPIMRRVEQWVSPPIGKNLLLIAQKI